MFFKHAYRLLSLLALASLLSLFSGCGSHVPGQTGGQRAPATGSNAPDSVQIHVIRPDGEVPLVTLRIAAQVQQFYQTTLALPPMPLAQACTAELGPHYELTFLRGTHVVAQIGAKREGCRPVTIAGESSDRQGTQAFWDQLDHAIFAATPVAKPQALAIQRAPQGNHPAQTARIADAAAAQRLYNALVALPQTTPRGNCPDTQHPDYWFSFQTTDQMIPVTMNNACHMISLDGAFQSRSGLFLLNDQFKALLTQTLTGATFAPAQPDQLTLTLQESDTTAHLQVRDAHQMQQIYGKVFTLPIGAVPPDCPSSADKIAGKSKWYTLNFTQWGLPIMNVSVYEGSCKLVQPTPGIGDGQTLLGDPTFWDILHQMAHG